MQLAKLFRSHPYRPGLLGNLHTMRTKCFARGLALSTCSAHAGRHGWFLSLWRWNQRKPGGLVHLASQSLWFPSLPLLRIPWKQQPAFRWCWGGKGQRNLSVSFYSSKTTEQFLTGWNATTDLGDRREEMMTRSNRQGAWWFMHLTHDVFLGEKIY